MRFNHDHAYKQWKGLDMGYDAIVKFDFETNQEMVTPSLHTTPSAPHRYSITITITITIFIFIFIFIFIMVADRLPSDP